MESAVTRFEFPGKRNPPPNATYYAENAAFGYYNVTFIVNESRQKLTKCFDSPYQAKLFVNKLRHSKRCTLISYPLFN